MQVEIDEHVRAVLNYMQENIPASKLVGVGDAIPKMARLLWDQFQQEPVLVMGLRDPKPKTGQEHQSLSIASV
jgi:hypothetical protein